MALIHDLGKKVKGKLQKVKGEAQIKDGYPLEGAINKIKGSINEGIANSNIRSRNRD